MRQEYASVKRRFGSAIRLVLLLAAAAVVGDQPAAAATLRQDFKRFFDAAGTDGTIVVRDAQTGVETVYNPERAAAGFLPSSTFKVPNSLIALEAGSVGDVDRDVFTWDGTRFIVDGKPLLAPVCEGNVTLRTALQNSCVWVYQQLARRIGEATYARYLGEMKYGNGNITSVPVDSFWLRGDFKISAESQVEFLTRLVRNELPFSGRTMDAVRDIMTVDKTTRYTLHAKTGYAFTTTPRVGWWVGYVDRHPGVTVFALNLDMTRPDLARARMDIAGQILRELNVLPSDPAHP
jgi:beta-lactamase class D